jgi:VanZ family protein
MKYFIPVIIWTVIITILSTMPGLPSFDWNLVSVDKAAHFTVYAILSWLVFRGFYRNFGQINWKYALISFAIAAFWGMLMEWIQGTFFPYRSFEWPDEVANIIGAAIGVAHFLLRKK